MLNCCEMAGGFSGSRTVVCQTVIKHSITRQIWEYLTSSLSVIGKGHGHVDIQAPAWTCLNRFYCVVLPGLALCRDLSLIGLRGYVMTERTTEYAYRSIILCT